MALACLMLAAILQDRFHIIKAGQWWPTVSSNLGAWGAIILVLVYLIYHLVRAPWKLDLKRQEETRAIQKLLDGERSKKSDFEKAAVLNSLAIEARELQTYLGSARFYIKEETGLTKLFDDDMLNRLDMKGRAYCDIKAIQKLYQQHWDHVKGESSELGFTSRVTKSPSLSKYETDEALEILAEHEKALSAYAAKLMARSVNETIS